MTVFTALIAPSAGAQVLPECYAKSELGNYTADAKIVMKDKALEPSFSVQLQPMKTVENGLRKSKYGSVPYFVFSRSGKPNPKSVQGYSWSIYLPSYENIEFDIGEKHEKLNLLINVGGDKLIESEITYDVGWVYVSSDDQDMATNQAFIKWLSDTTESKMTLGLQEVDGQNTAIYVFNKKTLQNGVTAAQTLYKGVTGKFQKQGCKPIGAG